MPTLQFPLYAWARKLDRRIWSLKPPINMKYSYTYYPIILYVKSEQRMHANASQW